MYRVLWRLEITHLKHFKALQIWHKMIRSPSLSTQQSPESLRSPSYCRSSETFHWTHPKRLSLFRGGADGGVGPEKPPSTSRTAEKKWLAECEKKTELGPAHLSWLWRCLVLPRIYLVLLVKPLAAQPVGNLKMENTNTVQLCRGQGSGSRKEWGWRAGLSLRVLKGFCGPAPTWCPCIRGLCLYTLRK